MNYKLLIGIACIVMPSLTFGQRVVTGRVVDSDTRKPIKEVRVAIEGARVTTVTNILGYFQLTVDSTSTLVFEIEGYEIGKAKAPKENSFQIPLRKDLTPGGMGEFYKYFTKNVTYPAKARTKGTQGRVYVSFDVDSLQGIQNINVLRDIGENCGKEIVRVLEKSAHVWIPKTKSITLILPVEFRLDGIHIRETIHLAPVGSDIELPKGTLLTEMIVTAYLPNDK